MKAEKRNGGRLSGVLLAFVMALSLASVNGSAITACAEETDMGLCAHHGEHTAECGYIAEQAEVPCDQECVDTDGDGEIDHAEGCAYAPAAEGQPCGYVCRICPAQELIDALPDADEITADIADEVKDRLSAIDEARAELTEEEQDSLDMARYGTTVNALEALAGRPEVSQPMTLTLLQNGSPTPTGDDAASVTAGEETAYYDDFTQAWSDARNAGAATVTLLKDVNLNKSLTVYPDEDITFAGGDYTLYGNSVLGVITLYGGSFKLESGTISGGTKGLHVSGDADVTISGGEITVWGDSSYGVYVEGGIVRIIGGTITAQANGYISATGVEVVHGAQIEISGSAVISASHQGVAVMDASAVITGGTIESTRSDSLGVLIGDIRLNYNSKVEISGEARIQGKAYGIDMGSGTLTISGGTISAETDGSTADGVVVYGGEATITGGTISGKSSRAGNGISVWDDDARAEIRGGSFTGIGSTNTNIGDGAGIYVQSYNVTISGGTFYGNTRGLKALFDYQPTLSGGAFEGGVESIWTNGDFEVGVMLAEGYGYKQDSAWVNDTSVIRLVDAVTVKKIPIQDLAVSPETVTAVYGSGAALTASVTLAEGITEAVSYQWYDEEGAVDGATDKVCSLPVGLNAGTHAFYCAAVCDGYEVTSDPVDVTVEARDIADAVVELGDVLTADGRPQKQAVQSVTVKDGTGGEMAVTYTVTGDQGTEPGVYTMTLTGTGNFTGTVTKTFVILPAADSKLDTDENGDVVFGEGTIGLHVRQEAGAPEAEILTDKASIIEMLIRNGCLTTEELVQVAEGARIDVILKVSDATHTITAESRGQIEKAAEGYTIGQYMDISLFKQIAGGQTGAAVQITGVLENIRISVKVPDSLQNTDSSVTRAFRILRSHGGRAEFLSAAYDTQTNMLIFDTDRFSDYAIAYQDTTNAGGSSDPSNTTPGGSSDPSNTTPGDASISSNTMPGGASGSSNTAHGNPSGASNATHRDPSGSSDTMPGDASGLSNTMSEGTSALSNTAVGISSRTGDSSDLTLWLALMIFAAAGIVGVIIYGRKKKEETHQITTGHHF